MSCSIAQASKYFKAGFLTRYRLQRFHGFWLIELYLGGHWSGLSPARSSDYRQFKSLDSAVKTLESIGFDVSGLTSV